MVTEQFEFTVPPVTSNTVQVPSLSAHTANLVENYMIVAFGKNFLITFLESTQNFN